MSESISQSNTDDLLAISRRLDWRFVFADPRLGHVVVLNKPDNLLKQSVELLAECVTYSSNTDIKNCDMLVMCNPAKADFTKALESLQPKRFYLEFERGNVAERIRYGMASMRCAMAAEAAGYHNVRWFWHWKQIASANRIIPLDSPEALQFVITKGRSDSKTRLKSSAMNLLLRTGILAQIVASTGLAGERHA